MISDKWYRRFLNWYDWGLWSNAHAELISNCSDCVYSTSFKDKSYGMKDLGSTSYSNTFSEKFKQMTLITFSDIYVSLSPSICFSLCFSSSSSLIFSTVSEQCPTDRSPFCVLSHGAPRHLVRRPDSGTNDFSPKALYSYMFWSRAAFEWKVGAFFSHFKALLFFLRCSRHI